MMQPLVRKIILRTAVFILSALAMTGLLVLAASIPPDLIREKSLESAEYLSGQEIFGCVIKDVEGSRIDKYADAILLNIASHYDPSDPLRSVMLSAYYFTPYQEEKDNFLESVREDKAANRQYLRYWHGSNIIVRPLLTLLSVKQIYVFNGIILVILFALYIILCVRYREPVPGAGMTVSLILTSVWFVPLSLEYTWTVQLMLVFSSASLILVRRGKRGAYGILLLIAGMVTNYFDFLTAETLTLLVPLLLILWSVPERGRERIGICIDGALSWSAGYVGMWILKWVLASLILGESAMPYVTEHIEERLGGDLGLNIWQYMTGAVWRNIICLFPVGYGAFGAFAAILLLVFAAYRGYVYHVRDLDRGFILLCVIIGLIPYIRYLVLHNHSYLHCFFTFRAQAATVLAVIMILGELRGKRTAVN